MGTRKFVKGLLLGIGCASLLASTFAFASVKPTKPEAVNKKAILQKAVKLQIPFIENQGQIPDESVRFYARTFGGTAFVTDKGEIIYSFPSAGAIAAADDYALRHRPERGLSIKETLIGASVSPPKGIEAAETKVNYFIGNDPDKWKTNLPTFNTVSLGEVYPGIELSLKAYGKNIEKIFTVKPGANIEDIRLNIVGANFLRISAKDELEVETQLVVLRFTQPLAYQEIKGEKERVEVSYDSDRRTYGFKAGKYDKERPLIIDPLLASTFIGGGSDDRGYSIALGLDNWNLVSPKNAVTGDNCEAFYSRLGNDHPIKGVAMMGRKVPDGMCVLNRNRQHFKGLLA